jgi:hypothetical protein
MYRTKKLVGAILLAFGAIVISSNANAGCVCSNSTGNWYCAPNPSVCMANFGYFCNPPQTCNAASSSHRSKRARKALSH